MTRYYQATCECGWVVDAFGVVNRRRIARAAEVHSKQCTAKTRFEVTVERVIEKVWRGR